MPRRIVLSLLFAGLAAALLLLMLQTDDDALVVYCAHDSVYSQQILDEFRRQTGIDVAVRFDTEATKSLGLVNLLLAERDSPRCDVFWNNQVLGTAQLQTAGALEPYRGPGWERIPAAYKDPDGYWTGFAGRLRVIIFNTERLTAEEVDQQLSGDLSKFAFAKPLFGTTLSHFSLLWRDLGGDAVEKFHDSLLQRGATVAAGNATVKNLVAEGACDFGWTDTDDFFVAQDDGRPVAMLPIRTAAGETICIPNSVAIIRGTRRLQAARQLVDFLLSQETELQLAASKARQIPLGPFDNSADVSDDVRALANWADDAVRFDAALVQARDECLEWLTSVYLQSD